MYHIIVFSFNRAMQCDSVLRSIFEHVKTPRLTVSVVWRATGQHLDGYARLRQIHEPGGVRFYEQSGQVGFFRHVLPRLWMPRNLYHWLRLDYVRKADNFKPLLERVIAETPGEFVSFNTDDNVYYRDEPLPEAAFRRIRENPYGASYRVLAGKNLLICPPSVRLEGELLRWDYYDPAMRDQWAYPFSVDGSFYDRVALLKVIHRVLYHNPVTLEGFVVGYVRQKRLFREGLGPLHASLLAQPINKVSFIVPENTRGNVCIESLNRMFLDGYRLELELPASVDAREVIPEQVYVVRNGKRQVLPVAREEASQ